MKDKKEFYTVSEFAEIVGISRQAVYKKLNNQFKPFVNVIKGKKYLSHKALELFPRPKNDNQLSTKLSNCQPNCQPTVNQVEQPILNFLQEQITAKDSSRTSASTAAAVYILLFCKKHSAAVIIM